MSGPVKRSVRIAGHRTSISLEPQFWTALQKIADQKGTSVAGLIALIDKGRAGTNLSSAVRVYVLHETRAMRQAPE